MTVKLLLHLHVNAKKAMVVSSLKSYNSYKKKMNKKNSTIMKTIIFNKMKSVEDQDIMNSKHFK